MMRLRQFFHAALLSPSLLLGAGGAPATSVEAATSARKIYADYHSPRYTREHDGAVGVWKFSGVAKTSKVPHPEVNRNPDLIDADGRHELAAAAYPLVGMQSELDPDYLEYQVLSAKTAGIDGFFVEWGFKEHSSEGIRQALTAVAARYDFEIGITICDRWLFMQLPGLKPELKERAQLMAEFQRNYAFLRGAVLSEPTTPRYRGRPVLLLFGGGLAPEELRALQASAPAGAAEEPLVFIRPLLSGVSATPADAPSPVWEKSPWYSPARGFTAGVAGFFGWVPTRARTDALEQLPGAFDRYGTLPDAINYLRIVEAVPPSQGPRISCATPGFDNRTCAGWGSDFSYLPRGAGEIYRAMWTFNEEATDVDWVYLPTWNDWTEGSQIEPSVEDGGRFLKLTVAAAARFKGTAIAPDLTELPRELFELRRRIRRLKKIGASFDRAMLTQLDATALALSRRDGDAARAGLVTAGMSVAQLEARLPTAERLVLTENQGLVNVGSHSSAGAAALPQRWRVDESAAETLKNCYYEAVLEFEYRPTARGRLQIVTDTDRARSTVGDFSVVADVSSSGAGDWRTARVRIFAENAAWRHRLPDDSDIEFRGAAEVRNVRLRAEIHRRAR